PTNPITGAIPERRRHLRFELEAELDYQVSGIRNIRGTGQVLNISSRGVAFRTEGRWPMRPSMRLKVSMAWPVLLDGCSLRLVFEGVVLRAHDGRVVVTIERPQFHVAGKSTAGGDTGTISIFPERTEDSDR